MFSVAFNLLMFIPAFIWKTDKLTDLSYSLTFFAISVGLFLYFPISLATIVLTSLVCLWAIRLGTYLFVRIHKMKKDDRFDGRRENFFSFINFWLLQGISVWFVMLSLITFYYLNPEPGEYSFTLVSCVGMFVLLAGLLTETVADIQKYKFKNNPENKGKWIDSGLWHYTRHPNYFGEILVWVGLFVTILPFISGWLIIVAAISPIYIYTIIMFVSGVPLLEKKYNSRWADNPEYKKYKESTNLLIPCFRK